MSRQIQVTFDAHDPSALSSFWRDALGYVHPGPPEVELPEGARPPGCMGRLPRSGGRAEGGAQHEIGYRGPGRARPTDLLLAGSRGQNR